MKKDFSKPKKRILSPSRALLVTHPDGHRDSATWIRTSSGWQCFSASRGLRWMRKSTNPQRAAQMLSEYHHSWQWITPQYGRAITPPFMP